MTAKSTLSPITFFLTLFVLAGCSPRPEPPVVVYEGPLFCDVEEPRRFSQAEIDWRSVNAPWNLRRDFATNATWDRECVEGEPDI